MKLKLVETLLVQQCATEDGNLYIKEADETWWEPDLLEEWVQITDQKFLQKLDESLATYWKDISN